MGSIHMNNDKDPPSEADLPEQEGHQDHLDGVVDDAESVPQLQVEESCIVGEADKEDPVDTVTETDEEDPGDTVTEADEEDPGDTVTEADEEDPGDTVAEADDEDPGDTVAEAGKQNCAIPRKRTRQQANLEVSFSSMDSEILVILIHQISSSNSDDEQVLERRPKNMNLGGRSRQSVVGERLRKLNHAKMKSELEKEKKANEEMSKVLKSKELELQLESLGRMKAETKLKLLLNQIEDKEVQRQKDDKWIQHVYRDLTPEASKLFKLAVVNNRHNFEPGTLTRLRKASGVNFSQVPVPKTFQQTERAAAIKQFAILNSSEIPDMKANHSELSNKKVPNKRFAIHYLTVLHDQFNIDHPSLACSYSTFAQLWPSFVIKPRPGDFSSCHCTTCENNSLLMAALVKWELAEESQDVFLALKMERDENTEAWEELEATLEGVLVGERKDEIVTCVQWEMVTKEVTEAEDTFIKENGKKRAAKKEQKKRVKSIKVKDLAKLCQEGFKDLKEHLHRNVVIKKSIAEHKEQVLQDESGTSALVWVDWSEGLVLRQNREVQSAWFGASSLSLQSGFIFRKNRSQGFGSFSEGADHKVHFILFLSCFVTLTIF